MIVTYLILAGIVILIGLYARLNVLEARRRDLAQKRWDAIQAHVDETADAPLVWS